MGRIQSNIGLSTGTDIKGTIDQLLAISARPRLRLEARVKDLQSQQVAINEITALVLGVQLQTERLGQKSSISSLTSASSATDVIKVSTTGTPVTGNYSVQSIQTSQTSAAASNAFTSSDDLVESGEFIVRTGGFVDGSAQLADLRGGTGISRGKIQITDRSGSSREVDLSTSVTIDDVVKQINSTTGIKINAKISGDRIVLTDTSGVTTSNLIVAEVGEGHTAAELGLNGIDTSSNSVTGDDISFLGSSTRLNTLLDNRGLDFASGNDLSITLKDGTNLSIDLNATKTPATVGQLISAINASNSTKLEAKQTSDGNGIEFVDKTTGSGTFAITGQVADQLGVTGVSGVSGTIASQRLQSTLQGPLLGSLNGGRGIGTPGIISIRNRAGTTTNVDLSNASNLRDVIDRINQANAGVTAGYNRSRTGISLQDTTGATTANLLVTDGDANNTATKLSIAADVASNSIEGTSLGRQSVSLATELSKLNQGRGVRSGSFKITDSTGKTTTINLAQIKAKTVGDVIEAINGSAIDVDAKLNETGDGFVLIDTGGGNEDLIVEDTNNGNAALDLSIRGKSKTVTVESVSRKQIESSQTFRLTLTETDKLTDVVKKINEGNGPLTASILTAGPSTVRLLFSSRSSGNIGRIAVEGDDVGINASTTTVARDAIVSIGSSIDAGGTIVQSSSNSFDKVIDGLQLTVLGTSTSPVDISVTSSNNSIEKSLQLFVDQFNKVYDKLAKETAYDPQSNSTGQLFGSSETLRVELTLRNFVTAKKYGTGNVKSLEQLGIRFDSNGKLSFDKSKLNKLLETNAEDVEQFLSKKDVGFSARGKKILDGLTATKTGALLIRNESLQHNIEESNRRIDVLNGRLEFERTRLEKQFYGMEEAIAKIKNNASGLSNLQFISL